MEVMNLLCGRGSLQLFDNNRLGQFQRRGKGVRLLFVNISQSKNTTIMTVIDPLSFLMIAST
jgi:hypothetical protein